MNDRGQFSNRHAEAYLSLAIGAILLIVGRTFVAFLFCKLTGQTFHTGMSWTDGPLAGQEVGYFDLENFVALSDVAIGAFGLTLLVDGVIILFENHSTLRRPLVCLAIFFTSLAIALNGLVAVKLFHVGITPTLSLLAIAFGGFILLRAVQSLRAARR